VRRVAVESSEGKFPTRVEVTLNDGRRERVDVAMPVGSLATPISGEQLRRKFDECVAGVVTCADLERLHALLGVLDDLESIAPLMAQLGGSSPARADPAP
jgi:hypothetical protein